MAEGRHQRHTGPPPHRIGVAVMYYNLFALALGTLLMMLSVALLSWVFWLNAPAVREAVSTAPEYVERALPKRDVIEGWFSQLKPDAELPLTEEEYGATEYWTPSASMPAEGHLAVPVRDELGEWYPDEAKQVQPMLFWKTVADEFGPDALLGGMLIELERASA